MHIIYDIPILLWSVVEGTRVRSIQSSLSLFPFVLIINRTPAASTVVWRKSFFFFLNIFYSLYYVYRVSKLCMEKKTFHVYLSIGRYNTYKYIIETKR